ncbi:SusD/RagB family nutrient-binding outer membrane lipoprotein [Puia sp.]|uniref:SusD/RagB family nutrient-binding outer membrane lipoprotein n=1 Tax=Puia sp. TaxID=2045100 RepID=UPI002F421F0D
MKLRYKAGLMVMISGILITTSCKKTFWTDYNVNPNALAAVTPDLLLPTVEAALAYTQGGDESRFTALLTQQMFGANSQSQTYYLYGLNPGVFDNLWPDLYTSTMQNDYTLIQIADKGGYNRYGGIARIIMAYQLQVAVDLWGDLPYSQALHGNAEKAILHPTYDKALGLYDTIASLINVGTAMLQSPDAGVLVPTTQDVIYKGDEAKWIKFGHAIKGRLALHQSKGSPQMAATALQEFAQSFTSSADNAQYVWGTTETSANPWYQFYRDRPGDEDWPQSSLAASMTASNDPRYGALDLDSTDAAGTAMNYYNMINSPTELITYDEMLFAIAEATLRSGGSLVTAQSSYQAAITANMKKLGVDPGDAAVYLTAHGTLPVGTDAAIAKIASEEYVALFLNPEVWTLWRRTGSPTLVSTTGNQIPRRLLYPQSELNFNADNVPSVTLYSPTLFWDK